MFLLFYIIIIFFCNIVIFTFIAVALYVVEIFVVTFQVVVGPKTFSTQVARVRVLTLLTHVTDQQVFILTFV